jgi:ATP-dependent DNA helicase RecG
VYRANSDISQGWLRRLVAEALAACGDLPDPLPPGLRIRHDMVDKRTAMRQVHLPTSMACCEAARRRLAFEEVFFLQLFMLQRKAALSAGAPSNPLMTDGPAMQALAAALPYDLTDGQRLAVGEILADLARNEPMSRLLMGDVGSGKTAGALHALVAAADSGLQAAMMAPTEVLASQYMSQLGPLLDRLGVTWALLTSAVGPAERAQLLTGLSTGSIQVAFGTHALLEPDVAFARLALAVIDEQHRFGVGQRETLRQKGGAVHYLAMTATPIPRSLALTIYGDLDVTVVQGRPRMAASTSTTVLAKRSIGQAYDAVRLALSRGEQAYVVCPLIGQASGPDPEDDGDDSLGDASFDPRHDPVTEFSEPGDENIAAAERERDFLAQKVFADHRVGLMTSRLPVAEKRRVMDDFRSGRIDVLVSTTVIEVGVDVPNATVMVIQDADRFGLSQLHQLRGRVGRGARDGQAFLVSGSNSPTAKARLGIMERSSDGFELAEEDLRLRREGDILGLRQHGRAMLRLTQVVRDAEMIQAAHHEARRLLAADPGLNAPEHAMTAWERRRPSDSWQAAGGDGEGQAGHVNAGHDSGAA